MSFIRTWLDTTSLIYKAYKCAVSWHAYSSLAGKEKGLRLDLYRALEVFVLKYELIEVLRVKSIYKWIEVLLTTQIF